MLADLAQFNFDFKAFLEHNKHSLSGIIVFWQILRIKFCFEKHIHEIRDRNLERELLNYNNSYFWLFCNGYFCQWIYRILIYPFWNSKSILILLSLKHIPVCGKSLKFSFHLKYWIFRIVNLSFLKLQNAEESYQFSVFSEYFFTLIIVFRNRVFCYFWH